MKFLLSTSNSDMSNRFILAVCFIFLLLVGQVLIARYVFKWNAQVTMLDTDLRSHTDILYFGDSIIKSSPDSDISHASIAEFLASLLSDKTVADVSQGAADAKLFAAMTDYIARTADGKPQAIIIPINLRSFSPQWYRRPVYQFERQKFILRQPILLRYFFQPLAAFHTLKVPAISQDEFLNSPVYLGTSTVGLVKDFEYLDTTSTTTDIHRQKFIYAYMSSIGNTSEELLALEEALRIGKKAGIPIYVYITPINYKNGALFVGKDFIPRIEEDVRTICDHVTVLGDPCLNLAFSLGTENFDSTGYPSEHLNEDGRRYVAQEVYAHFFKKTR